MNIDDLMGDPFQKKTQKRNCICDSKLRQFHSDTGNENGNYRTVGLK